MVSSLDRALWSFPFCTLCWKEISGQLPVPSTPNISWTRMAVLRKTLHSCHFLPVRLSCIFFHKFSSALLTHVQCLKGAIMHWYASITPVLDTTPWTITGPLEPFHSQSVFPCSQGRGPVLASLWLVWSFLSFLWPCWRILHFPALEDPTASTSSHSTVALLTYLAPMRS